MVLAIRMDGKRRGSRNALGFRLTSGFLAYTGIHNGTGEKSLVEESDPAPSKGRYPQFRKN